jgi:tetratricopeptide (TPR) repeat protein
VSIRTAAVALAVALSWAAAPAADGSDLRREVLDLLHDGRFDAADRQVERAVAEQPTEPGPAFLRAFVSYWRLLYDPGDDHVAREFEARLERTLDLASAAERAKRGDPGELALWRGSSHLLLAQLRASQRKPFGAAFEAKKAKRALESAVEADSPPADSDFGIGTYQYYADQVPTLVKGLRSLLFIPGGDRDQGLARLERAARSSRYFALEARILLATIYADDRERLYDEALRHAETALARHPEAIVVLHGAARLDLALHRPERARRRLDRALARADALGDVDRDVVATLRYYAARAELAAYRPDRALTHARAILDGGTGLPEEVVERTRRIAREAILLLPDPATDDPVARTLVRARPALELEREPDVESAFRKLDALARESPEDPVAALLAGRAALLAGHPQPAYAWLRRAEAGANLPERFAGDARLRLGMASDWMSRRGAALAWYGRAESSPRFDGHDAVRLYRGRPFEPPDLGWGSAR